MNKQIKTKENKPVKCCLCGKEITGYGHNAQPVKCGVCCDSCNENIVIPNRVLQMISFEGSDFLS